MSCNCNKPNKPDTCGISPAVLSVTNNNCTLFHKVIMPASMGDSKENPPYNGMYKNVLLYYEADQTSWLFSSDGVPTKLVSGVQDYEAAINLPQINGETLIGDKNSADLKLADAPMVITIASGNIIWSGADTAEDIYNFFLNQGKVNVVFEGSENYGYEIVSAAYIPGEQKMMCTVTAAGVDTGSSPVEFAGNALYGLMTFYTAGKAVDVSELDLQLKLSITDFTGLDMIDGYVLEGVPATSSSIGMVKPSDGLSISSDGTLTVIDHVFDTVAGMKASTELKNGDYAQTLGFYSLNDGGGAIYKITNAGTANEMDVIGVGSLYANLILPTEVRPEMLGAYGDNSQDDTNALKRCIELKHKIVGTPEKIYKITYIHTDVNYIYLDSLNIHTNSVSPTSPEISVNTYKRALQFESNGNFTFTNCNFTTEADQENTTTWLSEYTTTPCSNVAFLQFNHHVKNLNIEKCTFENAIFDIWVDGGSDTVEGNANVEDCTSKNTCIFFDSRYLLNTYINNCKVKQADTATSYSHLIYCTFGDGMNITIENTELKNGVEGGAVIDCYHGSNYNLVVNNTNINVIKAAQYALLCCDGGKAVITNCNIKSDYLIYQSTLTTDSNARFVNCNIDVNSFNANISSSDIACEFIGCDIKTSGCYRNNSMTDSTKTKLVFKSSKINLIDGNIRYYNIKAIDSEFYIKDTTSAFILTFQNAGFVKNCYFENLPDSVTLANNFWDVAANATTFVNNITKNLDANKFYNGTEINTTVIA